MSKMNDYIYVYECGCGVVTALKAGEGVKCSDCGSEDLILVQEGIGEYLYI